MGQTPYVFNSPEPQTILYLPDAQAKPGTCNKHLTQLGRFVAKKQPDILVCAGDFADMPSLSSYDVGKKSFEGRRYKADIEASRVAMTVFMQPIWDLQEQQKRNRKKVYQPLMHLTLGNHENRINRAVDDDPKLDGTIGVDDLAYESFGWTVHDFLEVIVLQGIAFSHYFTTGAMGRPASSAQAQLNKMHMSCIAGHQQGFQLATGRRADGAELKAIIAGSCYSHREEYLGNQGNNHFRGALMLHNCIDGQFDLNMLPLRYLEDKYSG